LVPGSEFVVARTALRSNASNYYVDGRKSSFGEVTDLLKAKGIDLDNNRFLILQACSLDFTAQYPHVYLARQILEPDVATKCSRAHLFQLPVPMTTGHQGQERSGSVFQADCLRMSDITQSAHHLGVSCRAKWSRSA